jgi:hypothetical protein
VRQWAKKENDMPDLNTFLGGFVSAATILGTLVVIISWTNLRRARYIEGTKLFLEFRNNAIGESHQQRVTAASRLLLDNKLTSEGIEVTLDISAILNDWDWVGYFVRHGIMSREHAQSTFGRDIKYLYPALYPYMEKVRMELKYRTLWEYVDYLYKVLMKDAVKRGKYGCQSQAEIRKLRDVSNRYQPKSDEEHAESERELRRYLEYQLKKPGSETIPPRP